MRVSFKLVESVRLANVLHSRVGDMNLLCCCRYVFGVGIILWIWLRKMRLKGAVQHVVLLITRKRLLERLQNVKGKFRVLLSELTDHVIQSEL